MDEHELIRRAEDLAAQISRLTGEAVVRARKLERAIADSAAVTGSLALAEFYRDAVLAEMNELRVTVDELETLTAADYWPYPTYGEILFSVK